ncbi:TauD/TfdA family dioxygenase [Thiolinea disciformis]|uniref:TauD/TfdA family dioxygenase n=1 Tax=Thiolinea disciformis TaxID=125614 RepID=UPI0003685BEB|nr:TauD/TfdA family dioxygenase [Thiolinea disciformis]
MLALEERGLRLSLANGDLAYFNYYWLRDNCTSAWDESTQERIYDILEEPDDLKPKTAQIDASTLTIEWPDGHQSRYDLAWLARWHYPNGQVCMGHGDLAQRKRQPWYADHYSQIKRFSFPELIEQPAQVADWTEALLDEGIALLTEMPNSNEGLQQACELIGVVRSSFSGYTFDVRTEANPVNLAYTNKALELHTDLPPEELAPGIQFLHCRVNDAIGGESLFVDACSVAQAFKAQYPDYFNLLTTLKVPFRYTTNFQDVRARQVIIELDPYNGEVSGIHFSQHLADVFDFPPEVMDAFYPAFRKFGQMLQDPKYLMRFRLNAGECIVFDNHRVVHGRSAFVAGSGARHLRGCYVDRNEMRSTYRVLRAKYPKGEAE